MSESVRQRRFGSSHRADSSPSVRTQAAAPEYPALHVRRPREPAHTGHPRGLHPHSHAHPFTEAALCTYPPPRERHGSSAGSHGARIQPPPHCSAKSKAADLPPSLSSTRPRQSPGGGGGRRLCTRPGLTMSLAGGVGSPKLVLLTRLQTGRLQGLPQRYTCPSIPAAADQSISEQGSKSGDPSPGRAYFSSKAG